MFRSRRVGPGASTPFGRRTYVANTLTNSHEMVKGIRGHICYQPIAVFTAFAVHRGARRIELVVRVDRDPLGRSIGQAEWDHAPFS